jgi:hypothetical protein
MFTVENFNQSHKETIAHALEVAKGTGSFFAK